MSPKKDIVRKTRAHRANEESEVEVRDERRTGPVVADSARALADVVKTHSNAVDAGSWSKLTEGYGMFMNT